MKKWLKGIGIALVSLLALLLILPFAFKGKIVEKVDQAVNQALNAKVSFNHDVSLSLLRNFPNLSVGIDDVSIVGVDSFANDTLLASKNIRLVVDIQSVISGATLNIRKIFLNETRAHIIFLKSGAANFDIAKADTGTTTPVDTTQGEPLSLKIKELTLKDAYIQYTDHSMDLDLVCDGLNLNSSGDFEKDIFTLYNDLKIARTSMTFGGLTLLSKANIEGNTNIDMDLNKMKFGFADNALSINELPLKAKGWVELREKDMDMDIDISTPSSDFKSFLSIVPGCYSKDFSSVKASGKMALAFTMKGIMDDVRMPTTHVGLKIDNAGFQYPGLPASASGIFLDFKLDNADGNPDNTRIVIEPFKAILGKDPIEVHLDLQTPVSNPFAKGSLKLAINLDNWKQLIPLDKKTSVSGKISADCFFDGHYSSVEKQQFNDLKAGGTFGIQDMNYSGEGLLPVSVKNLLITAAPQTFALNDLQVSYGKSSISMAGKLENTLGYVFAGETLKGDLSVKSSSLDLNEWMNAMPASETPTATDTAASAPMEAVELPTNLDLAFSAEVGKLLYDTYKLSNCQLKATVKDGKLSINPMKGDIFGATVELNNVNYSYEKGGKPNAGLGFRILNLNPANLRNQLAFVQKYAPILADINGLANLQTQFTTQLTPTMDVDYATMAADGLLDLVNGKMEIPKWLAETSKKLNWGVSNMVLIPTKAAFAIREGKFQLKDTVSVKLPQETVMRFSGTVGLDEKLNLGGIMVVKGKKLPFTITGTVKDPKMQVNWKALGKETLAPVLNNVKDKALAAAREKADKLLATAQEQADKIRATAKEASAKLRSEGASLSAKQKAEADKLEAEALKKAREEAEAAVAKATDPLSKKAAKLAADKAYQIAVKKAADAKAKAYQIADKTAVESDKKAVALETEANAKADKLLSEAQAQADKIIADADAASKNALK